MINTTREFYDYLKQRFTTFLLTRESRYGCRADTENFLPGDQNYFIIKNPKIFGRPFKLRHTDTLSFRMLYKFYFLVKKKNIDLFLMMENKVGFYFFFIKLFCRKKIILWIDNGFLQNKFCRLYIKTKVIDHYLCSNKDIFKSLIALGLNPEKTTIIPPAVNSKKFFKMSSLESGQLGEIYSVNNKAFVYFFSGSLQKGRGVEILLESFRALLKTSTSIRLVISWIENPQEKAYKSEILKYIKKYHLSEFFVFLGKFENKIHLYNIGDVMVLPYTAKSAIAPPLTLIEAMMCETAVITTRINEMQTADIIKDKNNGILCGPNVKDLTEAMLWALKNKNLLGQLGKNARATSCGLFGHEMIGKRLMDIISIY
ncbi:MAG: hypothetical protein A2096_11545 [Spirochaetes bacterium GWF1_41_5]|nr:MAG: hypothetical protein A2096_11545 [Spirochaetes bacterium GWF1_41_5]